MSHASILRGFETILEMLRDRHLDIGTVTKQHMEDVLKHESIKQIIEVILNDVKVIFYTPPKFKWADVKKYFEDETPYSLYILVVQENITQNNMKSIHSLPLNVEVHTLSRLQFNITKHVLVPKHEVVRDKKEVDDIVEAYKLKNKFQLPIILKTDPIAKYYGMKSGDVVKITRNSPTAGEYIGYRCCL